MDEWKNYETEEQNKEESSYYYTETIKPEKVKKQSSWKKIILFIFIIGLVGGTSISVGVRIGKPLAHNIIQPFLEQFNKSWTFQEDAPTSDETLSQDTKANSGTSILPVTSTGEKSPVVEIAKKVGPSVVGVTSHVTVKIGLITIIKRNRFRSYFGEKG